MDEILGTPQARTGAGRTKSTFFRPFPDKREVLFGGETTTGLLSGGMIAAPATATRA